MTKLKVFMLDQANEKEVNDFLAGIKLIQDGLIVREDRIAILYREKNEYGMEKDGVLAQLSNDLKEAQNTLLSDEGVFRMAKIKLETFEGTDEMKADYERQVTKAEKQIVHARLVIKEVKKMIKDVENDEWTAD